MNEQRRLVVEAARSWLGVRYKHKGRSRRGVDCVGLLFDTVNRSLGMHMEDPHYVHRPTPEMALREIRRYATRITIAKLQPGDVVLMQFSGVATHFGIYTGHGVVHACAPARRVIEQPFKRLTSNLVGAYRLDGVSDAGGVTLSS